MARTPANFPSSGPWGRQPPASRPPAPAGRPDRRRLAVLIVAAAIALAVAISVPPYLQKWLWMRQLGYAGIFWTLLSIQWAMFAAAFGVVALFLGANLAHAIGAGPSSRARELAAWLGPFEGISAAPGLRSWSRQMRFAAAAVSAAAGLVFAFGFRTQWDTYIRFRYGGPFGVADPLFGKDVGFYVFRLPFYELLQHGLVYLVVTALLLVGATYALLGSLRVGASRRIEADDGVIRHLCGLLVVLFAAWAWGFVLDHYDLVYSTLGVVYGAGYAADHVTRVALWVMVAAAAAAACGVLAAGVLRLRPRIEIPLAAFGLYAGLYVVGIVLLPNLYQKFVVAPNELALETPYLKSYIKFTRQAYQLDGIQEKAYPALSDLTAAAVARNRDTIDNIRLWDSRPLLQTYRQTQAIRLYYQFYHVDTDRYHLTDGYHQVMVATRELSPELPARARTWVNQYLQFTHGNGAVMNFVSKTDEGGNPRFVVKNVPAESPYGLAITRPDIYYGRSMRGYRIVATGIKEFDYPKGNDNVYTSYHGTGGIPLDSLWKRVLFAWTQGDINILLTSYLTPQSRIQIWRRVRGRVARVAPFLKLDRDPYPVLSGGRLYWILDAYTVSDDYPYADPAGRTETAAARPRFARGMTPGVRTGAAAAVHGGINYIRNSVKVVVDMYDGSVEFYVMDAQDPVLAAYRRAFPGVFKDLGALSPDLKRHLRYPRDLFSIQADRFRAFHMTDPQVFYNREDLWEFPQETYGGRVAAMRPYYALMKIPGSNKLRYLLMTPFTPQKRDNMIAWMAADSDFPGYGKMLFYRLPKERLVYGPKQVEAMIDQNTTISSQLTLWDQRGSRVVRGIQIVTPIENSFLYVVPVYLTAAGTSFPELKRVIVVASDKVVMARTLDGALDELFARPPPGAPPLGALSQAAPPPTAAATGAAPAAPAAPALQKARMQLDEARKAIGQGDWGKFGQEMDRLQHSLSDKPE